ncbi:DUF2939 domain-containing protein [Croceicoccus mobilis]|uniref:DUF2939 domain-containing protein n=1 Tax=Croceicoccus mobilis TaxID=1703339 RepID=A0A916Z160_9SPHN|nr:DUF2939 domain-containing protein [Croceicoccus mobilis]GGD71279.1 hypothetical protein GCM10010990_20970 [Croceicoccus mobilis]
MRKFLGLLLIACVAVGGWYFGSQYYALHDLRQAARAGDEQALRERIDFPALRISLEEQVKADLQRRSSESDDVLGRLGNAIAGRLSGAAINLLVTPETMAAIVEKGRASGITITREEKPEWDIERTGLNSFRLTTDESKGALVFERRGLGWRMTGLELADG